MEGSSEDEDEDEMMDVDDIFGVISVVNISERKVGGVTKLKCRKEIPPKLFDLPECHSSCRYILFAQVETLRLCSFCRTKSLSKN